MDVFQLIEGLERLPRELEDREREITLLRQLDLPQMSPDKLRNALAPSVRRQRVHPPALDAFYASGLLDIYPHTERTNYARDAIVHMVVQGATYRLWPWALHEPREIFVQVGGLGDLGFVCAGIRNPRSPSWLVPWAPIPEGSSDERSLERIAKLVEIHHGPRSSITKQPLARPELRHPIGVLVLADPPSLEAVRELLHELREHLSGDLDLVVYGEPALVRDLAPILELDEPALDSALVSTLSVSSVGHEEEELVLVRRHRSAETRVRRARRDLPIVRLGEELHGRDHVLEVTPARREPSRRPLLIGRQPSAPADRAFLREHAFLIADSLPLPAAEYAVLHDCTVGGHGMIVDRSGHWIEDTATPYHRAQIRALRARETSPVQEIELPGLSSVLASGGSAHTHWLVEGLMRLWVFPELGLRPRLLLPTPLRSYQRRFFELLGYRKEDLLETRPDLVYRCEKLVSWIFGVGHQREVLRLVGSLSDAVGDGGRARPERIFVPRSDVEGYRECLNEELLFQGLARRGFELVLPSRLSAEEEIRVFRAARTIIGPLGAGLNNVLFSRPGARILAYTARSYMEPHLHVIAHLLEHELAYWFCDELESRDADPESGTRNSSYVLDVPAFLEWIDATLPPV
ncbi:MAG: DUF563 domain-containing protein [Myxococcota bacterium]